jgi:hypothetical protein
MLGRHAARGEQNLEDDENLKRVVRFTIGAVRAVASTLARLPWGCRDQKDKASVAVDARSPDDDRFANLQIEIGVNQRLRGGLQIRRSYVHNLSRSTLTAGGDTNVERM